MHRPSSPYENFVRAETGAKRTRDYCYASTPAEHKLIFQEKTLIDLKNWRLNCRNMLQTHIDNKEHLSADYAEKCSNLSNRIDLLDEEIERREKIWAPTNAKATDSLWQAKLKLMDERASKRQRIEEASTFCTTPRPSILGYSPLKEKEKYAANVLEEKFTFNCTESLGDEEEEDEQTQKIE